MFEPVQQLARANAPDAGKDILVAVSGHLVAVWENRGDADRLPALSDAALDLAGPDVQHLGGGHVAPSEQAAPIREHLNIGDVLHNDAPQCHAGIRVPNVDYAIAAASDHTISQREDAGYPHRAVVAQHLERLPAGDVPDDRHPVVAPTEHSVAEREEVDAEHLRLMSTKSALNASMTGIPQNGDRVRHARSELVAERNETVHQLARYLLRQLAPPGV
mmetsp:Transcript_71877/g.208300  ORF Transcript_71877/g.208300 Transcript_71877/m.208300 type:complete len:218 (-) Transcript_71877:347-1000(-)